MVDNGAMLGAISAKVIAHAQINNTLKGFMENLGPTMLVPLHIWLRMNADIVKETVAMGMIKAIAIVLVPRSALVAKILTNIEHSPYTLLYKMLIILFWIVTQ